MGSASGADAVLLIARIVPPDALAELVARATATGIEPLVEVANDDDLDVALRTEATLIGVNARDLDTLAMDEGRAARVLAAIPDDRIAIHLSGVKDPLGVARVARSDADAALIGEALMRVDDPTPLLRSLLAAATP
jgi:indole-3-glycerol phosphate synthase